MKNRLIILIFLLIIGGISTWIYNSKTHFQAATSPNTNPTTEIRLGTVTYQIEVATTPTEQALGLSDRPTLAKNAGMLFVYNPSEQPSFWMRRMQFPIDIIWIKDGKIVDMTKNLPVPPSNTTEDDLPTFKPNQSIDYALEINAGQGDQFKIGDLFEIKDSVSV